MIAQYPEGKQKSAILRVLHLAQAEFGGWLSVNTMNYVAEILNLKPIEVYEVASFYSMYNLKPVGKYMLEFCHTATCATAGVESLIDYTCKKLGVKTGETTADGLFTIKEVECLGACGYAPMLQLGKSYREHLTPEKIDALIEELRTKK
ncbi:MAG: NADH-quinone oxidoreductase subunit NuoE [Chitinophagales bacterium]